MNFQQLKIIREAARQDYNLTEVANMLFTSQSGVSRHIRELEDELGIEIFVRRGKRLLGMTEPGKALLVIAERILNEASNVRRLADLFTNDTSGVLTIATTHTQARYSLPEVIKAFRELFPEVRLELIQGTPQEIATLLQNGEADIGIASERLSNDPQLVAFPSVTLGVLSKPGNIAKRALRLAVTSSFRSSAFSSFAVLLSAAAANVIV